MLVMHVSRPGIVGDILISLLNFSAPPGASAASGFMIFTAIMAATVMMVMVLMVTTALTETTATVVMAPAVKTKENDSPAGHSGRLKATVRQAHQ